MLNVVVVGVSVIDEKLDLNVYGEKFGVGVNLIYLIYLILKLIFFLGNDMFSTRTQFS